MASVLAIYDRMSLEMRDALAMLAKPKAYGYASWAGAFIEHGGVTSPVRRPTLDALARRELVLKYRAPSGTWRYEITKLGKDVAQ